MSAVVILFLFLKQGAYIADKNTTALDDIVMKYTSPGGRDICNEMKIKGRFIASPGHSPDSWTLIMDDGRAFCGEAAMNYLNILGAEYRPIFIADEEKMYKSLNKILTYNTKIFYTDHGAPFGKKKIEGLMAERKSHK